MTSSGFPSTGFPSTGFPSTGFLSSAGYPLSGYPVTACAGNGSAVRSDEDFFVDISFTCLCAVTQMGDALYVTGSHPLLGKWDCNRAIPLRTDESSFPLWQTPQDQKLKVKVPWPTIRPQPCAKTLTNGKHQTRPLTDHIVGAGGSGSGPGARVKERDRRKDQSHPYQSTDTTTSGAGNAPPFINSELDTNHAQHAHQTHQRHRTHNTNATHETLARNGSKEGRVLDRRKGSGGSCGGAMQTSSPSSCESLNRVGGEEACGWPGGTSAESLTAIWTEEVSVTEFKFLIKRSSGGKQNVVWEPFYGNRNFKISAGNFKLQCLTRDEDAFDSSAEGGVFGDTAPFLGVHGLSGHPLGAERRGEVGESRMRREAARSIGLGLKKQTVKNRGIEAQRSAGRNLAQFKLKSVWNDPSLEVEFVSAQISLDLTRPAPKAIHLPRNKFDPPPTSPCTSALLSSSEGAGSPRPPPFLTSVSSVTSAALQSEGGRPRGGEAAAGRYARGNVRDVGEGRGRESGAERTLVITEPGSREKRPVVFGYEDDDDMYSEHFGAFHPRVQANEAEPLLEDFRAHCQFLENHLSPGSDGVDLNLGYAFGADCANYSTTSVTLGRHVRRHRQKAEATQHHNVTRGDVDRGDQVGGTRHARRERDRDRDRDWDRDRNRTKDKEREKERERGRERDRGRESDRGRPVLTSWESGRSLGQSLGQTLALSAPKDRERPIYRDGFILANSGPIEARYKELMTVGRGTWGEVKAVVDITTGTKRAAKKIPKYFVEDADRFRQEIEIMKTLDHPNIVRLFESFEDSKDIYLVMDYCAGGELFDRLVDGGTFNESLAARVMVQILQAVAYCHSKSVCHRDLKPENFLFLNKSPWSALKLIDFGLASLFREGVPLSTKAGTPYYVSPQVLEGSYGAECDVWSAGVIMYILLCGYPPFNSFSDRGIMEKVKTAKVRFNEVDWAGVSDDAKHLISLLLQKDPSRRIRAEQALRHRWFKMVAQPFATERTFGQELLTKFRRFQGLSRLKKIALTIIAQNIDENEIATLRDIFLALDTQGDGVLSVDEVRQAIQLTNYRRIPADLEEMLLGVNTSGSGAIDFTEFIAACLHQTHYKQEEICKKAFSVLDINQDGRISAEELKHIFFLASGAHHDRDATANANLSAPAVSAIGGGSGGRLGGGAPPSLTWSNDSADYRGDFAFGGDMKGDAGGGGALDSDITAEISAQVQEALLEADCDGDGCISFPEFVSLMRRVPSRTLLGTDPEVTAGMMRRVSSRPNIFRPTDPLPAQPPLRSASLCLWELQRQ